MNKKKDIDDYFSEGFENIYKMKLGERFKHDIFDIWRVPGGWIFGIDGGENGITTTFIPYIQFSHNFVLAPSQGLNL